MQQGVQLLELYAVDDHHALLGAKEPEAEPLGLLGGGHVDDGAADAGEPALQRQVQPLAHDRVSPVVDAVKGVDCGDAEPASRQTTVEAGALAVGMNQGDTVAAD